MKVAILADIHGNIDALNAVISSAKSENVTNYIIAGDLVGYYYGATEVVETINNLNHIAIRGNHEDLLSKWFAEPSARPDIRRKYGSSFNGFSMDFFDNVLKLPKIRHFVLDDKKTLLCHGTPWNHDEYLYPDADEKKIEQLFAEQQDMLIFGHTHYPVVWENSSQIIVNPGSVGQPRDRKRGACWALWDTKEHIVDLRREVYDMDNLIRLCEVNDPELRYLQDVLTRDSSVHP